MLNGGTFILAIDQGTTGTTVALFQNEGSLLRPVAKHTVEFPQHYPQPGWVEHDVHEIWDSVRKAVTHVLGDVQARSSGFKATQIAAIGITNQRETLSFFDQNGNQVRRAIVWQCRRSDVICTRLRSAGVSQEVQERSGLLLDPYFSGTKLGWVLENEAAVKRMLLDGQCLVGTIDSYLIYRMTSGQSYVTEVSNASRTMLMNLDSLQVDNELKRILNISNQIQLPEILSSDALFGKTSGLDFLPDGISIHGVLGDQQAALAGRVRRKVGQSKCSYGTGAFILTNTGRGR